MSPSSRLLASLVLLMLAAPAGAATVCEELSKMSLPRASITLAQSVPAGGFTPPAAGGRGANPKAFADLPAFCRVAATLRPTADSEIAIEVWLPSAGWNGKYLAVGNGGWSGSIDRNALAAGLRRGYATAATDTGHEGGAGPWMFNREKLADWAHRAVHETAVASKAIINAFYGDPPKFSYFQGCSAGGRQGMKQAQRYPEDFNGIIAGAPGLDWTSRAVEAVRVAQAMERDPARQLPQPKRAALNEAVLKACDGLDGVADGVLENPRACKFDPAVLQCRGSEDGSCLTEAQVQAVRDIYAGSVNPKTGRPLTGLERGGELGWTDFGWTAAARSTGVELFRYVVDKDLKWDLARFDFAADVVRAEATAAEMNALDPNLKPFFDRGGRLIQYHGWSDPQISPGNSVQYYERLASAMGGPQRIAGNYRLFMVPGMGHCGGGAGTSTFDMLAALEQWVEQGRAPDRIPASRVRDGKVDRTRPLCPYPQVAVYSGSGTTDDAANFVCR
ncbi:MAG TPA: tannase/feruloyl esterase family alpha/beta hydrolase [Vicinamibacterales bacterium]|nr:tannase/feruloyl esterase family alpha/beta hydrolase [Vicinamibacterales bacterium]